MLSDLRILPMRLAKRACTRCGYACRSPLSADPARVFDEAYELGAAPPSSTDRARQQRYANWIADALSETHASVPPPPTSVRDVGCGNGGLLLALRERWPAARLSGLEPSPNAARRARDAGLDVIVGIVEGTPPPADRVDLAVAVNVLEHATDPDLFVRRLADGVRPGGTVVIICPDGAVPGLELLFVDHLHSFTSSHLAVLCRRAGLPPRRLSHVAPRLQGFQMIVADRDPALARVSASSLEPASAPGVAQAKSRYLDCWRALDPLLAARLSDDRRVICFGVGEAAGLLRAYAPVTWARVTACTLDGDDLPPTHAGLPVVPLDHLRAPEDELLLAVNPADQLAVAARLRRDTPLHVVTWADLIIPYSEAPPRRHSLSP